MIVTVEVDVGISDDNEVEMSMEDEVGIEVVVIWDEEVVVRGTGVGRIGGLIVGAPTRLWLIYAPSTISQQSIASTPPPSNS